MASVCNCTDLNRITRIVDGLVKESAEEKAHLANQWWVIVIAYTCVVLPWGLLYTFDFISEKWRTIHRTRFLGRAHMFFAIVPMPFIIYYAHLQQTSQDYKEMMTAVIAVLMSLYHVMRTGFGLMQLACFSKWCSVLIQRMRRMDMIDDVRDEMVEEAKGIQGLMEKATAVFRERWNYLKKNVMKVLRASNTTVDIESDIADTPSESEKTENLDRLMGNVNKVLRINNTLIDNELGGTDMTVKFMPWKICITKLKTMFSAKTAADRKESDGLDKIHSRRIALSDFLTIEEKEMCFVRWSGSFLSSLGEFWSGKRLGPSEKQYSSNNDEFFENCKNALTILRLVTFPVNKKKIQLRNIKWNSGGAYDTSLDTTRSLGCRLNWLKHRKRELENQMDGFPESGASRNERRSDFVLLQSLQYAKSMDEVTFDSLIDYRSKFTEPNNRNGWSLLLWQCRCLPSDRESAFMNPISVPPFPWRKLMVPLWDRNTNWRVLQASVHIDNKAHCNPHFNHWESPGDSGCWFECIRKGHQANCPEFKERYTGTVLESVRTFLACWVSYRTPKSLHPNWCPKFRTKIVKFSLNQDIILDNRNKIRFEDLWRWECQSKLQEEISKMNMNKVDLPSSIELIILFILGFPGRISKLNKTSPLRTCEMDSCDDISAENGVLHHPLMFSTGLAPQNIKVLIRILEVKGEKEKSVELELISAADVTKFHWQDWINSAMGFIEAADKAYSKEEMKTGTKQWRKRTPRKANLNSPLVTVSANREPLELLRDVQVWTGWPFFDIKIVQFEMYNCLRALAPLYKSSGQPDVHYSGKIVEQAEKALEKISEWPEGKWRSIIEEDEQAMDRVFEVV